MSLFLCKSCNHTHNVQLNTKVVSHLQGASPWLCWRTWSLVRFIWWKFLRPTAWAMGRSLTRWSWPCEQTSPPVMILASPVAPHTPQVSWCLTIDVILIHFQSDWAFEGCTLANVTWSDSVVSILHSLFWWLLPPGPKVNDRDHCGSLHRSHLHHHLRFHHCLQRQKQVLDLNMVTLVSQGGYRVLNSKTNAQCPWVSSICSDVMFVSLQEIFSS